MNKLHFAPLVLLLAASAASGYSFTIVEPTAGAGVVQGESLPVKIQPDT